MTPLSALALFGCGSIAALTWANGLYASCALATAIPLWIVAGSLWRQARRVAVPDTHGPTIQAGDPDAAIERRRWQSMLDQMPAPLLTVATDNVPRAANRAARQLFRTDDRIRPQPALQAAIALAIPGERGVVKLAGEGAGSRERSYALSVANSIGPNGAMRLAVLTDIEAELQAAEAAALRDLLHVLSHEIMNSLTPVTSLAESVHQLLLEGRSEDLPDAVEALETILRRASGLERFVTGYRTLARLPPPDLRSASVRELLDHVASLFSSQWPQVELVLDLPESDIAARVDADQLTQALLNLLTNAAEAALQNSLHTARVELHAREQASGVEIRVKDSGRGVEVTDIQSIFTPFFTSKRDGSGIGLGLARQIVRGHGGELSLSHSSIESGATFVLKL